MNLYEFFKFSSVGSISQYGTLQKIMGIESSLYMLTGLAGEESEKFIQLFKEMLCIRYTISKM